MGEAEPISLLLENIRKAGEKQQKIYEAFQEAITTVSEKSNVLWNEFEKSVRKAFMHASKLFSMEANGKKSIIEARECPSCDWVMRLKYHYQGPGINTALQWECPRCEYSYKIATFLTRN